MDIRKLQRVIVDALEDVKAKDIQVFNTEHLSPLFERMVVASASSGRQTKALASSVKEAVKKADYDIMPRSEGEENAEWIIVDCGAVVVHVMQPVIRAYYQLEEIWGEKTVRVKLLEDKAKEKKAVAAKKAGAVKAPGAPAKKTVKKVAVKKTGVKKTAVKKVAKKVSTVKGRTRKAEAKISS